MQIYYDFHIHSCLSLCAEEDMTPGNIAGMAMLAGLDAFAISDHNSALNCPAALAAAERMGLLAVPAMELCTSEEAHVLCLFSELDGALGFSEYVRQRLMPAPRVKWRQSVVDENDEVTAQIDDYLGGASGVGIYEAAAVVKSFGGVAVPAHIDRPSFSLLANLGFCDPDMGFSTCEVSPACDREKLVIEHPDLAGMRFISDSDAHELTNIPDKRFSMEVSERTAAAVVAALSEAL